jgi:hypothetical protein
MAENKTIPTKVSVTAFMIAIEDPGKLADAREDVRTGYRGLRHLPLQVRMRDNHEIW